ncbi:MAG: DUF2029 domain-containing protein [Alphaproteobacteria bacterium]|nr:DUF2029 domain-containing protein [Alphaproteobacteria bacterium]
MNRKKFTDIFRKAAWLTPDRLWLWASAFAMTALILFFADARNHMTHGITDARGEQMGRDFINYYSGALLAAKGQAKLAYDVDGYFAFQKTLAGPLSAFRIYSYPPILMLLTLPLALCSFTLGFALWTGTGLAVCWRMLSGFVKGRFAIIALLGAPAGLINILSGQNGFYTAALLAGGLMLLESAPVTAGALLGMLCYKPQFGLLLPLALAAGGKWRSFVAAGVTVIALVAGSTWLCGGFDIWPAFVKQMQMQVDMVQRAHGFWHRMPTVFSAMLELHAPRALAWGVQGISTLCAAWLVLKAWRSPDAETPREIKYAVLILAAFAATPYAWDYDMAVQIFALAWVARVAQKDGWRPWEKTAWMTLIISPVPFMLLANFTPVQPGPVVLWWVLWVTAGRVRGVDKAA